MAKAPATFSEADLIPLSAVQHMLYCPRQCALIHNEQQWAENRFTAEGRILHERVDSGTHERRSGLTTARSVALRSLLLGLAGVADVVEIPSGNQPYPIEYKRGKPKSHRADQVQLCAQAICLEEMLGVPVPEGALFYGQSRRRQVVHFDAELRELTERTAGEAHSMLRSGKTPLPKYEPRKCNACSLQTVCQPRMPRHAHDVAKWVARAVQD